MTVKHSEMTDSEKLDVISDAISTVTEMLDALGAQQEEILEKLNNINTPGFSFEVFEEES